MKTVSYKWSETADTELCKREERILSESVICYHCGRILEPGELAAVLKTSDENQYILHGTCADLACRP